MTYRGFLALNNEEICNSSRVVAHIGGEIPTLDSAAFGGDPADCSPIEFSPGLGIPAPEQVEVSPGLATIRNGSRRVGPGLGEVGECWGSAALCAMCKPRIGYDDSWPGLREYLGFDQEYRIELAPWHTTELPESAEFGGVWMLDIKGLDTTPVERTISQAVGHGGVAMPYRDASRTVSFDALLIGCSHAGVDFGLNWLTCLLRTTNTDPGVRLKYFTASPSQTQADPDGLIREAHNVVLTKAPEVTDRFNTSAGPNRHANIYAVNWEMTLLTPYAYMPQVDIAVVWDSITHQPINWIHAADCAKPETCEKMPVMFSADCVPTEIEKITAPPPVCGGCMPVGGIAKYLFRVPTMDYAFRCRETAVSTVITNVGENPLTLQAFWRVCGSDVRCEDNQFPLQVAGLPPGAELHLDGITGRYKAFHDGRWRRPVGVVGTPNGAPWLAPVIDREICWDFIVQTATYSEFTVTMALADREP